jgi:23S rRNA (uridine2552-2'-O)-methyltransferase
MARTKSSRAWLRRHVSDPYVHKAKAEGYRSRAVYKLIEIAARGKLLRPGAVAVDLGAAPGGWSQALAERVGRTGRVIAVDFREIQPIPGVTLIRGDFSEEGVLRQVEEALGGRSPDLVVSDMAPNVSGVKATDQALSMNLCELALDFARAHLKPEGALVVKAFQGAGYPEFLARMRRTFVDVASRKPGASRGDSSEMFLVGMKLRTPGGN